MSIDKKRGKSSRYKKRRKVRSSRFGEIDISDFSAVPLDDENNIAIDGDDYSYNNDQVTSTGDMKSSYEKQKAEDFLEDEMNEEDVLVKEDETKNSEVLKEGLIGKLKLNRSSNKKEKKEKKRKEKEEKIVEGLVGDLVDDKASEENKEYFKCIYTSTDNEGNEKTEIEDGIDKKEQLDSVGVNNNDISFGDMYEEKIDYSKYNKKSDLRKVSDILEDCEENDFPIIELLNVSKTYQEGIDAVKNVSFRVNKGEFVFVVGKSGSGKSTLIKLLTREIRPTSGRVYVNGREITKLQTRKIAKFRRSIGVVFQDFKLLTDRNVFDNVAFAQRVIEKTTEEINRNVPAILSVVGLSDKMEAFPYELSGGEQQRVVIARALVNEPTILLADEPTGNLDPKTAWEIMELLEEINKRGTTVIVVTHNVDIVDEMRKRVIALEDGSLVSDEKKGGYSRES